MIKFILKLTLFSCLLFFYLGADEFHSPYVYQSVNVITGEYCEKLTDLRSEGRYPLSLKRVYSASQGWSFNHPNIIHPVKDIQDILENGNTRYTFETDGRLKEIISEEQGAVFHFSYYNDAEENEHCLAKSDDGSSIDYLFVKTEHGRNEHSHLLQKVYSSNGNAISYEYRNHPLQRKKLLSRRDEPLGRYLINEYYDSVINDVGGTLVNISDMSRDTRIGKVKLQRTPAGPDQNPVITARFFYNRGNTEVYDALNNKTVYFYGKLGKLTSIENYLEDGTRYKTEKLFLNDNGQLTSKITSDAQNVIHSCTTFDYDMQGNLCRETIYGNLSGTNPFPIKIDSNGKPIDNGTEHYTILYRYTEDDRHLPVLQTEDDGKKIRYLYDDESNNILCKFTYSQNTLQIRQFFEYDNLGNLTANMIDDGSSEDPKNLTSVTERKITRFIPKNTSPALGLPESIEEKYLDLLTEQEILIKRTFITYTNKREIEELTVYDGAGNYVHTQTFEYDTQGQLIKQIDSEGNIKSIVYDTLGNPTQICENEEVTDHVYDYCNRVVRTEKRKKNAPAEVSTYRYDYAGNCVAKTDPSGNETILQYDAMGRLTKSFYPVKNSSSCTLAYTYDVLDRIIQVEDPNGDITTTSYNARGKPCKIEHSDGTSEFYEYELNGTLKKSASTKGDINTKITHDALNKCTKLEKQDCAGNILQSKETYYDKSGNKIKEVFWNDNNSPYVCTWTYGPFNKLLTATEGYGSEQERTTRFSYTSDGHIESITKPDGVIIYNTYTAKRQLKSLVSSDGSIHYSYHYNDQGRLTLIEDHILNTQTIREYNQNNQMILEKLGNGSELKNEYDIHGRRISLNLPDNSQIQYTYEADHLKSIKRISNKGESIYTHEYKSYSPSGKIQEEKLIGNAGSLIHSYNENNSLKAIESTHWKQFLDRDIAFRINNLTTECSSKNYSEKYEYDTLGQLIKEDGDILHHFSYDSLYNRTNVDDEIAVFDALGQLTSQGKTYYRYDLNGNLISCKNEIDETTFEYDALNRLIKIIKSNDSPISYTYDAFNRRLSESAWKHEETKHFLYDGNHEIGCKNENGDIIELRLLGMGIGEDIGATVAVELVDKVYAPIQDHRGSICCLIDSETGIPAEWYHYSSYGTEKTFSSDGYQINNPWKFCSKRQDPKTGLILFGQRYYCPEMGRWITKDPLGTPESINRYCYNLNDPINRIDTQGLFSILTAIDSVWNSLNSNFQGMGHTINPFFDQLSFTNYISPTLNEAAQFVFGNSFLQLSGFKKDLSEIGIHGKGEIHDKMRITLINGILNARLDYKQTIDQISGAHGGANVHYIFDASEGWCEDLLKALLAKAGYISPQAHMIADTWRSMIKEMGGVGAGGTIYHYAHSLGGVNTKAALRLMTPEEKSMIKIFTFGSASMITDESLDEVFNYVSVRDGICFLDPIEYVQGLLGMKENIIPVGQWLGIPFVDHPIGGDSYMEIIHLIGHQTLLYYTQ